MHRFRARRGLLVAAILAGTLTVPAARSETLCQGPDTFGRFLKPSDGQVYVQTQIGNQQTSGQGQAVYVSTTGTVEVVVEHQCVLSLTLTVVKQTPGVGPQIVYTRTWQPLDCGYGQKSDDVPVGLDGGDYDFELSGTSCNGKPIRPDGKGGFVGDPPLPL